MGKRAKVPRYLNRSRIEQYIIRGNPSFSVTAVDRATNDFQSVNSLREGQAIGFEYMSEHDWAAEAREAAENAVMKLKAKTVEAGKYDLVLHPSHLFPDNSRIGRASD